MSLQVPDWITFDSEGLRVTMIGLPGPSDFSHCRLTTTGAANNVAGR